MIDNLFPAHRLAMLPGRWVLAPTGGKPQVEAAFAAGDPLPALDDLLAQHLPGGRLRVTLSHHHVRLFLAAAPPVWLGRAEMHAWLASQLASSLAQADHADTWRLTWDITPPGRPIVVAAMPEAVLQGLQGVSQQRGIKLVSTRPWLADAWRRRRQLARASGWYAVLEPGRQVLLRLRAGQVTTLRQRHCGDDAVAELDALLTREALLGDLPAGGDLWLERFGVGGDWSALAGRYSVHEFAGPLDPAQALLS